MSTEKERRCKKMAISVARLKPLVGENAEIFYASLKSSKVKKEAKEKAKKIRIKGFNTK